MKENKALWEIVIILSTTLLVLTAYSWIDWEVTLDFKLKKSKIKTFLTEPVHQPFLSHTLQEQKRALWEEQLHSKVKKTSIDSTSQNILLTGDSMCEGLMFRFNDYAKKNKHQIKTVIWYSSTTISWAETDSLRKLIAKFEPSYIFFTTGSNELFIRNIEEREKYIRDIVQQAGNKNFIWIGPPNWAEDTGINNLIEKNVGKDRFFMSKNLKFERGNDGAHPTWSSAAVWADTISSWLMNKSRHKIVMNKPEKKI